MPEPRAQPVAGGVLKPELLGGGHRWGRWDVSPLARGAGGPRGEAVRGRRRKQVHRTYMCEEGKTRRSLLQGSLLMSQALGKGLP